ncbi:MAG: DUF2203 family protein [Myxococcota bacterium]|nr:hypothetical protein [Deltaproteobacteria bacterium]MCP4239128.1 DUF2203 domain-containing protein [bacterium]MDP6074637.1 DUF2203 family protein [Myxococcota bacterium]MDP6241977.1 DUF2203 family protein [Myxococcota bacterium]MDP7072973.1 DUF2203 family protein [Myxococcota bacterium]
MPRDALRWTIETAHAMLPEIRTRTAAAVSAAVRTLSERAGAEDSEHAAIDARLRAEIGRWTREMEALGVEVKGLWLVDFDNGSGYFCWKWPEEHLGWYHGYEDGFSGRVPIQ